MVYFSSLTLPELKLYVIVGTSLNWRQLVFERWKKDTTDDLITLTKNIKEINDSENQGAKAII